MDWAIVSFVIGAVLAGVGTWLVERIKRQAAISLACGELQGQVAVLLERVALREGSIAEQGERLKQAINDTETLHAQTSKLQTEAARLQTTVEKERQAAAEKVALLEKAKEELSNAFKALSAEALKSNNQAFIELATRSLETFQERAKGDLEKRQQAIGELVSPVRESLEKFDQRIQEVEKLRVGAYEGLSQQISGLMEVQQVLRTEASNLVRALGTPRVRGRWGEIQLKRVVEIAGMLDYCDFQEQQSVTTEDGRLRPDLIVRLPGGKNIVVDAKAPLAGYLQAIEAQDEQSKNAFLADHARHIRDHMTALGRKSYWEQFQPTPEFVILFLPGETFFSAALEKDPALIEQGVEERVIISTPTTLIALLKAVAYGWRQERMAENAEEVGNLGRELHKRISDVANHFSELGARLGKAVEAYNKALGSLESRVLVSARRFQDLKTTGAGEEIGALSPVDTMPRIFQAVELMKDSGEPSL